MANDFTPFPSSADSALRAASGAADRTTLRLSSVARLGSPDQFGATVTLAAEHSALRQESPAIQLGWRPGWRRPAGVEPPAMRALAAAPGVRTVEASDWFSDVGVTSQLDLAARRTFYVSAGVRVERNSGY
ncbi:MAG: hypothetical protein H3C62_02855, partial [Gemmatimonadaceae bacterium]|nr:hypothetical protein [Gemmatimonadaceae bacterium]